MRNWKLLENKSIKMNILKLVQDNVIKTVLITLLTGGCLSGVYWAGDMFYAGYKLDQKEATRAILIELMIDKDQMNIFVGEALASDTLKVAREVSNRTIIKAVADLSKKDSVNLRKELRLYMDLKESQTVSKEIGRTYKQINRLPHLIDSILSAKRRRTPVGSY